MKKVALSLSLLLWASLHCAAQKNVADLPPAHAAALQEFLSAHPDLDFMSERLIDADYLKSMRESLGLRFTPYYQKGDFNHDGSQDFAVILMKDVPPEEDPNLTETHRFRYQLTVVIFNGSKGGKYRAAFVKNTTAPLVCFINTTAGRKKQLYFGVFETDEAFGMASAGKGYIAEY